MHAVYAVTERLCHRRSYLLSALFEGDGGLVFIAKLGKGTRVGSQVEFRAHQEHRHARTVMLQLWVPLYCAYICQCCVSST